MPIAPLHLQRLIPAYAGSTWALAGIGWSRRAHPRLRGEHSRTWKMPPWRRGSSPLTRGALRRLYYAMHVRGLIPAYAGSTARRVLLHCAASAHPRLRGEHEVRAEHVSGQWGSSPLTRGARGVVVDYPLASGLIPAYAGSTEARRDAPISSGAHPRLRGEHYRSISAVKSSTGSSPLTRGVLRVGWHRRRIVGLIPAYAGSTAGVSRWCCMGWAHPRLRGEHANPWGGDVSAEGSSPLTRGARCCGNRRILLAGLIPAYAGSTSVRTCVTSRTWAHPRLRGEHLAAGHDIDRAYGSSPLTRGAPWWYLAGHGRGGLIPAYAGSTAANPVPCRW